MKIVSKSLAVGAIAGTVVFGGVFAWQYSYLSAHQPGVVPMNQATSYPPSAAWLDAAPWALIAFIATAFCFFVVSKLLARRQRAQ